MLKAIAFTFGRTADASLRRCPAARNAFRTYAQHTDDQKMQRRVPEIASGEQFDAILANHIKPDQQVALLLDYDGTLAPIAAHPSDTRMLPRTASVLGSLAQHRQVFIALISGRGRRDVQQRVALPNCAYSGNHGLEILFADGRQWTHELPAEVRANFGALVRTLTERLPEPGAWIENKQVSLTVHYRDVQRSQHPEVNARAREIIEAHGFVVCPAHEAIEAKPPVQWTKGNAAERILADRFGTHWSQDGSVRVVYAGDDTSDEDAMRTLQRRDGALTFRITDRPDLLTFADYRLRRQEQITEMLEWIEGRLE